MEDDSGRVEQECTEYNGGEFRQQYEEDDGDWVEQEHMEYNGVGVR